MKPEEIRRGGMYRFRETNTIYLMLFEWPADGTRKRELEYIAIHHNGLGDCTRRQTAEQLASWSSREVTARFKDVVRDEPDPRQTDVEAYVDPFLSGLV